jgi:hypothetical protein
MRAFSAWRSVFRVALIQRRAALQRRIEPGCQARLQPLRYLTERRSHHKNHKPQGWNANRLRSLATPGPRTHTRPADGMRSREAHPRLWINRSRRRNSHRGAKALDGDDQSRRNSCLHFRRRLGQIRSADMGPPQRTSRTETRQRSGQAELGYHHRRALIINRRLPNSLPADDTGSTQT